jgi:hypothetical protein
MPFTIAATSSKRGGLELFSEPDRAMARPWLGVFLEMAVRSSGRLPGRSGVLTLFIIFLRE